MNAKKLYEYTNACHIFMKIELDGEEYDIDCYIRNSGKTYRTSADYNKTIRRRLIRAFNELH